MGPPKGNVHRLGPAGYGYPIRLLKLAVLILLDFNSIDFLQDVREIGAANFPTNARAPFAV